jgi:hypothetical protein
MTSLKNYLAVRNSIESILIGIRMLILCPKPRFLILGLGLLKILLRIALKWESFRFVLNYLSLF